MQLDPETEKRIRARAAKEGVDPDEAVAEAKRLMSEGGDGEYGMTRPPVERLAPFFPFIRVRELRSCWLGLEDAFEDDELSCSDYLEKHPPSTRAMPAPKPANDSGNGQRPQQPTNGSSAAKDVTAPPA